MKSQFEFPAESQQRRGCWWGRAEARVDVDGGHGGLLHLPPPAAVLLPLARLQQRRRPPGQHLRAVRPGGLGHGGRGEVAGDGGEDVADVAPLHAEVAAEAAAAVALRALSGMTSNSVCTKLPFRLDFPIHFVLDDTGLIWYLDAYQLQWHEEDCQSRVGNI